MKLLNGAEIAGFIKERQAGQVRALRQAHKIFPKLAIIICGDNLSVEKYVALKQKYANEILIDVDIYKVEQADIIKTVETLNVDDSVHGIIVQLPLPNTSQTDEVVNRIAPHKDVDSLALTSEYDAATPLAILWLLAGYNVDLKNKNIVVVGQGRLVGAPLKIMLEKSNLTPKIVDTTTKNSDEIIKSADIIITAVGKSDLITADMIAPNAVVVDAGTSSEKGVIKGDLADDVYERDDLTITPRIGGAGPLTISALFENVIIAAKKAANK